jgi:hypothetical protein
MRRRARVPRQPQGKARSAENALVHGLTSKKCLLPHEDAKAFEARRLEIYEDLEPEGAIEIALVEQVVTLFWRLRRVPAFEAALFAWRRKLEEIIDENYAAEAKAPWPVSLDLYPFGRILEVMICYDFFSKLNSYERPLHKQLMETLNQFNAMKDARLRQSSMPARRAS